MRVERVTYCRCVSTSGQRDLIASGEGDVGVFQRVDRDARVSGQRDT